MSMLGQVLIDLAFYAAGIIVGGRHAIRVLSRDTGKDYGPPSWRDVGLALREKVPWLRRP